MVHPALMGLLAGHARIDELKAEPPLPRHWWWRAWRLSRLWRSWRVSTVVISNPKKEYHLAAWLAGIPRRVGYARKWGWLLTHPVRDVKALGQRHEVEYNLELIKRLDITVSSAPPFELPIRQEDEHAVAQMLRWLSVSSSDRLIAVHPWTSNPRKQWPDERFGVLLRRLGDLPGIRAVVVGGEEDRERALELSRGQTNRVLNLVGQLSLKELGACLQRARVLVCNDSGPMHVAAAVGTPVVALFGTEDPGSHPQRWGPWGRGHTVIHKPLGAITVDEVWRAVLRQLES